MTAPVLDLHHPDDETLAAFVDDRASAESREKVIEHLAECGECRDLVMLTADVVSEEETVVRGRFGMKWIAPLAAAAAVAGVVWLNPDAHRKVFGVSPDALATKATFSRRSTPGRVSVPLPHAKHSVNRGGGEPAAILAEVDPNEDAKRQIQIAIANNEDALRPNPRTRAVALILIAGSYDEYTEAVEELEKLRANASGAERDAITIDLVAALLGRNQFRKSEERVDARRAYELSDELWRRTRSLDAAWNRAAALEALGRDREAIDAWETYLKLDPNSEWATEARGNIDDLRS